MAEIKIQEDLDVEMKKKVIVKSFNETTMVDLLSFVCDHRGRYLKYLIPLILNTANQNSHPE